MRDVVSGYIRYIYIYIYGWIQLLVLLLSLLPVVGGYRPLPGLESRRPGFLGCARRAAHNSAGTERTAGRARMDGVGRSGHTYLSGSPLRSRRQCGYPRCSPCTAPAAVGRSAPSGYLHGIIFDRAGSAFAHPASTPTTSPNTTHLTPHNPQHTSSHNPPTNPTHKSSRDPPSIHLTTTQVTAQITSNLNPPQPPQYSTPHNLHL